MVKFGQATVRADRGKAPLSFNIDTNIVKNVFPARNSEAGLIPRLPTHTLMEEPV